MERTTRLRHNTLSRTRKILHLILPNFADREDERFTRKKPNQPIQHVRRNADKLRRRKRPLLKRDL